MQANSTPTPEQKQRFDMLVQCYRSGQVSEAQWEGHIKDEPGLAEYWERVVRRTR